MRDACPNFSSPDPDPLGLIDAFLSQSAAEDASRAYLAWLISLAPVLDPAQAARLVLARRAPEGAAATPAGRQLLGLLHDTMRWPRPAVATFATNRPHRKRA